MGSVVSRNGDEVNWTGEHKDRMLASGKRGDSMRHVEAEKLRNGDVLEDNGDTVITLLPQGSLIKVLVRDVDGNAEVRRLTYGQLVEIKG